MNGSGHLETVGLAKTRCLPDAADRERQLSRIPNFLEYGITAIDRKRDAGDEVSAARGEEDRGANDFL